MKKILEDMIIKWHQAGYALDEIAPLVPQVLIVDGNFSRKLPRRLLDADPPAWTRPTARPAKHHAPPGPHRHSNTHAKPRQRANANRHPRSRPHRRQ